ncbi:unnamed protein product [Candidula unifasciata]|uniref:UV-stimulated scaffold protein A C-terminal domain-containing protein n=1 Tax=Candidula unifasciata TaxID=100452 RepID=A0A8S3Z927_9EUPU|nr:unnamed protein product [Candidula unifasciata]
MDGFNIEKEIKNAGETLNKETLKLMDKCLYELTTTGSPSLDDTLMKKFKRFCRQSDDYVRYAFLLIMRQLNKKHSEIRLSAFQVADELFNRSHAFRETMVNHLQAVLALTTETETERPLPPPKSAAKKLKTDALHALQLWHDKYGQGYKKLVVGYNYLKNCKHVDFNDIRTQNQAERQRIENEEKRKEKIRTDKLAKVLKDIAELKPEIENCAREAESCLQLLLPTLADFVIPLWEESAAADKTVNGSSNENTVCESQELHLLADGGTHNQTAATSVTTDSRENQQIQDLTPDDRQAVNSEILNGNKAVHETSSVDVSVSEDNMKATPKENMLEKDTGGSGKHESSDDSDADNATEDEYEDMDASEDNLFAHGLPNPTFNLVLELPAPGPVSIQVTTDNRDVVCSLTDASKLITNNFLPQVVRWLEILGKNGARSEDIKAAIDLKRNLEDIKMKCMDLKLISMEQKKLQQADISDDDDFEEVPEKEGYEPHIPQHLRAEYALKEKAPSLLAVGTVPLDKSKLVSVNKHWSLKDRISTDNVSDPTSLAAALAKIKPKSSETATKTSLGSSSVHTTTNSEGQESTTVPVVAFGTDLAYWETPDQIEVPTVVKLDSLHRFWTPSETEPETPSQHDIAAVKNRIFYFTGKFEPVKWKCRAMMPNGKLCERMDRVKCPFHGKIVPRDKTGKPNGEQHPSTSIVIPGDKTSKRSKEQHPSTSVVDDIKPEKLEGNDEELPPWQDPELQREIELATGHDLGSARSQKLLDKKVKGKGKGKGKGKKKSKLTNIEAIKNTSRKRLENRIFNKGSMKRVCSTLDSADYRRVRDKFAYQFHYSLQ